MRLPHSAIPNL